MCLCVFVYELRIVSMDKILHFMNTLSIIISVIICKTIHTYKLCIYI